MLPQQYCLRWKYHHSNLQTMFSQLLDRGCFCDVTLACEGQLIRAHRVVLSACSTFFDTVLTNYASERDPIIIMKDVTFADVKCLIEFMYKGEINVEHAHLPSLLKTADDLKIKGLAEVSWRDDEDGPPPPTPATEFRSPSRAVIHDSAYAALEQQRACSPGMVEPEPERKSLSPRPLHTRMPTLTPIPNASGTVSTAAAVASASPIDHYLGPKRKRGRPPLDDAYDVFNVRKLAHYTGGHLEHSHHPPTYMESRHYAEEQRHLGGGGGTSPSPSSSAAAAYQQHIHQQQSKQRMRHRHQHQSESEEPEPDDGQADPEWITSNLEVNVGECEAAHNDSGANLAEAERNGPKVENDERDIAVTKVEKKRRDRTPPAEKSTKDCSSSRKNSNVERDELEERDADVREQHNLLDPEERYEHPDEPTSSSSVPQPVEEIGTAKQQQQLTAEQQLPTRSTSAAAAPTASSSASQKSNTHAPSGKPQAPPPLHHPHFGKYAPEGYLLNEHGMLMTHDYVHATTAAIPAVAGGSSAAAANGGNDHDFVDIKMEDFDAADLRLTSEEMSQWQDVIKMDDYLAKGRRPQFWEEPFTRRVLDAIKNKRLEMKKAARILGVSYGTLYGRYREVYGCLKHPYSSTTFRPSQSSQLAVQQRFDMVWPSPKRDPTALLPGHLEIGKIRPKDLSELWTRPQI